MKLALVTAPAENVITLDEAKLHMRVDNTVENDYIESLIAAAEGAIDGDDGWLGRALVTQTWDLILDHFPSGRICLPLPPLQAVTSIFYVDSDGEEQEVTVTENDDYRVVTNTEPGFIEPAEGKTWPQAKDLKASIRIRFTAGYGDAEDVPAIIKSWVKLMVSELYMNREMSVLNSSVSEIPHVRSMLDSIRYRG